MVKVDYVHTFNYLYDESTGRLFPKLLITLINPSDPNLKIETDAYLDSGAERSLFKADYVLALNMDFQSGQGVQVGSSLRGTWGEARMHRVRLSHEDVGDFELEIGFIEAPLSRNLLGRDFFNLIQIGFRERQQVFYITPAP